MARRADPGFRVIASLTDRFTKPIDGINRKIAESTAKVRGLARIPGAIARSSGLNQIGGAFGNLGNQVLRLRSSITGLLQPFLRLGLLVGGISFATFATDLVKSGSELIKLKASTGVAVEALQELHYAAKQSGVEAESMNGALTRLNKAVLGARKDTKGTSEAFKALTEGVGLTRKEMETLNTQQIFERVASAIANLEDESKKQAIAFALLGKSGTDMLPVLNEGAWGLRQLADEARSLGIVMSEDTARAAKTFDDTMTRLGGHIKGVALAAFGELLPAMQGGADAMDEWVKVNKEWLTQELVAVVRDLVAMGTAFAIVIREGIVPAINAITPVWNAFANFVGEGNAKLIAFTGVVAPGIIGALLGIAKAIVGIGVALVANPIGAIIAAIAIAVGLAAYQIWKHWDSIVGAFTWAVNETTQLLDDWGVLDVIKATFGLLSDITKAALDAWNGDWSTALDLVKGLWNMLPAGVREAIGAFISTVTGMAGQLHEAVTSALTGPFDFIRTLWDALPEGVRDTIGQIISVITGLAGQLRTVIIDALTSPIEFVKAQWNNLVGFLTGVWDRISGVFGAAGRLVGIGGGGGGAAAPAAATEPTLPSNMQFTRRGPRARTTASEGPAALATAGAQQSHAEVTVNFENLPEGARVREAHSSGNTDLKLNTEYAGRRGALAGAY